MLNFILKEYGLHSGEALLSPLGNGLINSTWKLNVQGRELVLQKINKHVFQDPQIIDSNLNVLSSYLHDSHSRFKLVTPLKALNGATLVKNDDGEYFRIFPYVSGSHSIDVVKNPTQAYEAARKFGQFTSLLSGVDTTKLQSAIPHFHDLELRFSQFNSALKSGNQVRVREASDLVKQINMHSDIVTGYEAIRKNRAFRIRVTHHDTKISNVLFDDNDKGICVIDLDTVMPGYFISDMGDMMRTYLSPAGEEEEDFTHIEVRDDFYEAIVTGYSEEMQHELTDMEKEAFFYSGTFIIYMQALRFFTDYLNNDVYYGARYPTHNLVRAGNQLTLLQRLIEKKELLTDRALYKF